MPTYKEQQILDKVCKVTRQKQIKYYDFIPFFDFQYEKLIFNCQPSHFSPCSAAPESAISCHAPESRIAPCLKNTEFCRSETLAHLPKCNFFALICCKWPLSDGGWQLWTRAVLGENKFIPGIWRFCRESGNLGNFAGNMRYSRDIEQRFDITCYQTICIQWYAPCADTLYSMYFDTWKRLNSPWYEKTNPQRFQLK